VVDDLISYKKEYLYVHLGTGSDVLNRTTSFQMPFSVHQNPTVNDWGSVPMDFKIYDGADSIRITVSRIVGNNKMLAVKCKIDYSVQNDESLRGYCTD